MHEKKDGAPVFEFIVYRPGALWKDYGVRDITSQGVRGQSSGRTRRPMNQEFLVDDVFNEDGKEMLVAVVGAAGNRTCLEAHRFESNRGRDLARKRGAIRIGGRQS